MSAILQFKLCEQTNDGRWVYWWAVATLWEGWDDVSVIPRPLERTALANIAKAARMLQAVGIPELTVKHLRALYWDRQYMNTQSIVRNERGEIVRSEIAAYFTGKRKRWIGARADVSPMDVEDVLRTAERVLEVRELLGLGIDWTYKPTRLEQQAARRADQFEVVAKVA